MVWSEYFFFPFFDSLNLTLKYLKTKDMQLDFIICSNKFYEPAWCGLIIYHFSCDRYRIPADANVEFYTAWVTQDPSIWTNPDKWQPERFLEGGEGYDTDITGTRGVRMMPFGVGRRICPAATLGILHVHLMLSRMVREFKWIVVPGEQPPDPTETFAFTVVLKEPLRAAILERDGNE